MEWSKETCGTWLLVSAGYCNPAAKLHPQIGYRRFTPARGGQMRRIRNVLVGTRFSPARGDRCTAHKSLAFGFLCPPKKRADQKPDQAPRVPVRVLVSLELPCFFGQWGRVIF